MHDKPEQILSRLFLDMFSAEELRRFLRYGFADELSEGMPGATASAAAVAEAASLALLNRGDLGRLWSQLIAERPRRQAEIEAARDRLAAVPARAATAHARASEPDHGRKKDPGPIRILFVLSCPPSQEQLALDREIRAIRDELSAAEHRHRFTHELVTAATYDHLRKALRKHKPHILHIACHGTPEAELILDDGHDGEERIDAATFVELLEVLKDDLRLVVLNACHSAAITREVAKLVGLVVGMRGAFNDTSAVSFAKVFYESIAAGDPVETSFRLGVNDLRRRKLSSNLPELLPAEGPQRQYRFAGE